MAPTNHVDLTAIMTPLVVGRPCRMCWGWGQRDQQLCRARVCTNACALQAYNALTAAAIRSGLKIYRLYAAQMTPRFSAKPMILLIIGGGIAAYKALETARQMQRLGLDVTGVMTKSAGQFITPLSVAALTNQKCYDDLFSLTDEAEMGHIRLARSADLVCGYARHCQFDGTRRIWACR